MKLDAHITKNWSIMSIKEKIIALYEIDEEIYSSFTVKEKGDLIKKFLAVNGLPGLTGKV